MIIELNPTSEIPLYVQLRNQIVLGIGRGELKVGERLPTVRQMAQDAGMNVMTVNKAYNVLENEGFIGIDRRRGAIVSPKADEGKEYREKVEEELELLITETSLKGISREEFLSKCSEIYKRQKGLLCSAVKGTQPEGNTVLSTEGGM